MATAATLSPLSVCNIIDKIGAEDSFFPTETPDCTLPGPRTEDTIALEESLRRLVARFQDLEQKAVTTQTVTDPDNRPIPKQVQHIKSGETKNVCLSCGHRLDVPLTPEESPPMDVTVTQSTPSIICSFVALMEASSFDGYETSESSDTNVLSIPSSETPSDAAVYPFFLLI
jgi:hypothetical protein